MSLSGIRIPYDEELLSGDREAKRNAKLYFEIHGVTADGKKRFKFGDKSRGVTAAAVNAGFSDSGSLTMTFKLTSPSPKSAAYSPDGFLPAIPVRQ
jgi:hypothetical protein